jgi:hypothetical protein
VPQSGPVEHLGDSADRTGVGGLEAVDKISMVAVPDLMAFYRRGAIDEEASVRSSWGSSCWGCVSSRTRPRAARCSPL